MATIGVIGLWHLGCVTAASLAALGHHVLATEPDPEILTGLQQARPPLYEPGLAEAIERQLDAERLRFTADVPAVVSASDFVFITFDTPVDEDDRPDLSPIERAIAEAAPGLRDGVIVVVMSQLPAGTSRRLLRSIRDARPGLRVGLSYSPENLRLGDALRSFASPERIVVGADSPATARRVEALFAPLGAPVLTMSLESAEMAKHALNAYLAASISFINEVADVCETTGADVRDVVRALKLDGRIGERAYMSPGLGFAGGTLARDVQALRALGSAETSTPLFDAVLTVNAARTARVVARLEAELGALAGATITLLGLTYKPGTSTLRRSVAIELGRRLSNEGAVVRAFDPMVPGGSLRMPWLEVFASPEAAASGADALVLVTEWPEFRTLDYTTIGKSMRRAMLFDCKNFLDTAAVATAGFRHIGIGIGQAATAGDGRPRLAPEDL